MDSADYQIALTLDDLRQLDVSFVSQWHRQPTPEEFTGLVESHIREEVLYREGLAMGLDKDDTIVKQRMAQKMEFLSEDVAAAHEPTTQELKEWFAKNGENSRSRIARRSAISSSASIVTVRMLRRTRSRRSRRSPASQRGACLDC